MFNPQDNTQLCVAGEKIYKLFRYSEGHLKQFAFMKTEPANYLCLAWLSEDRVVLGTDTGKVQLFEVGELKSEFDVTLPTVSEEEAAKSTSKKPQQKLA